MEDSIKFSRSAENSFSCHSVFCGRRGGENIAVQTQRKKNRERRSMRALSNTNRTVVWRPQSKHTATHTHTLIHLPQLSLYFALVHLSAFFLQITIHICPLCNSFLRRLLNTNQRSNKWAKICSLQNTGARI